MARDGPEMISKNFLWFFEMILLVLSIVLFVACVDEGNTWAVLVAGSKSYENFRHQADVCQAFQQLNSQGIPEERIIVFMYDDIAHSLQNPHKGSIINYPGGPNVYPGVPKDYTKLHVTPHNFMKVLKGESMDVGSKKTLKSTENDNVFVYFTDHGAPGILAFPFMFETLHAKDLIKTIEYMHDHKMYKKLVFYVEACESGSMFNGLLKDDLNVYAVTASNPFESSWACDYDKEYDAYLNDCWSGDWMADSREAIKKGTMTTRTLLEQFDSVHNASTKSPECAYGDISFRKTMTLSEIQGQPKSSSSSSFPSASKNRKNQYVSSRLVKFEYLMRKTKQSPENVEMKNEFEEYVRHMKKVDLFWTEFGTEFGVKKMDPPPEDHCNKEDAVISVDCNKEMVTLVENICGHFDEYSLQYVSLIAQGCRLGKLEKSRVEEFLNSHCQ